MSVRTMARVWDRSQQRGNDLLMLLAIADFADDDGRAYPAVATLAAKCRMTARNANRVLADLRASGELEVRMNEGPKGTNLYQIKLPLTEPSPLTVSSPLTESSPTPDSSVPKPLTKPSDEPSVNRQEPSTRKREKPDTTKFAPEAHLAELEVPIELISDWMELRKRLKAPVTRTAIAGIEREAAKAGIPLTEALRICCERSWRGFNASWLQDGQKAASQQSNIFAGGL